MILDLNLISSLIGLAALIALSNVWSTRQQVIAELKPAILFFCAVVTLSAIHWFWESPSILQFLVIPAICYVIFRFSRLYSRCLRIAKERQVSIGLPRRILNLTVFATFTATAFMSHFMLNTYHLGRITETSHPIPTGSDTAARLYKDVHELAAVIGERNVSKPAEMGLAQSYILDRFRAVGYKPRIHPYPIKGIGLVYTHTSSPTANISVVVPGPTSNSPVFVVGAHYDTALGNPGADDNASGVAVLLELASRFRSHRSSHELHFVAFGTEEPPFFYTQDMGSYHYASMLGAQGREVAGMASLEMLGYYSDEPDSQTYPPFLSFFFPSKANFVGAVSNLSSWRLRSAFGAGMKFSEKIRVVAVSLPAFVAGVSLSDNLSFWRHGYKAIMITDTAFLRYRHYHHVSDTPNRLDYERMAAVVDAVEAGIKAVIHEQNAI